MTGVRAARWIALIACLLSIAPPAIAVGLFEAVYSIAPLRSDLSSDTRIGSKRAGLLCGPAGNLRWSEARPDASAVIEASAAALRDRGIDIFVPSVGWLDDQIPNSKYRLVPKLLSLSIRLCRLHEGPLKWLGKSPSIKATGDLSVAWRLYDARSRQLIWTETVDRKFIFDRAAAGPEDVVEAAVASTASQLVERLHGQEKAGSDAGASGAR